MTISTFSAANHLCSESGWQISNLQLQKILYLTHMIFMGRQGGEPLIDGAFEAWDYGPVEPTLYRHVRGFGSGPIKNLFHGVPPLPPDIAERKMLDESLGSIAHIPAGQLVDITHKKDGAWDRNYVPSVKGIVIPNEDIVREYRDRFPR